MKSSNRRLWIGKILRQRPIGRKQFTDGNVAALTELADFVIGEDSCLCPKENVMAVKSNNTIRARIKPGADGAAVQLAQMSAAAEQLAKIANQGADVVSAANGQLQSTFARQIVGQPMSFVQINLR